MNKLEESYPKVTYEKLKNENLQLKKQIEELQKELNCERGNTHVGEKRFENLYRYAPLPYHSLDENGCFIEVNPAWLLIMGYAMKEVIGNYYGDFLHPDWKAHFKNKFLRFKQEGVVHTLFKIRHKNGHYLDIDLNGKILYNSDGSFKQTNCVFQDITDNKRVEEALKKKQYYLSKVQEMGKIGTWEFDILENKFVWTRENYKNFGLKEGTILSYEVFSNCIHPEDRAYVNNKWLAALNGKSFDIEHRVIAKGETKWLRGKAKIEFNKNGEAIYAIGFTQDITEKKKIEIELKEQAVFVNQNPAPVLCISYSGEIQSFNKASSKILKEIKIGNPIHSVINGFSDSIIEKVKGVEQFQFEQSLNGKFFLFTIKRDIETRKLYFFGSDITKRHKAEDELLVNEAKFRILADNTNDWEYWMDENSKYVFISPSCKQITGYPKDDFYQKTNLFTDLVRHDYKEKIHKHYNDTDRTGPQFKTEFPIINKSGKEVWIEHSCIPVFNESGKFLGRRGNNRDITKRKKFENDIINAKKLAEESEGFLKATLQTAMDGFWVVDLNGRFLNINDAYCRMSGYSRGELLTMSILDVETQQPQKEIKGYIQKIKQLGQLRFETTHKRKDGTLYNVEVSVQYPDNDTGKIVCFIKDISKQKKHEEELILAKELAEKSDRLKSAFLANMSHEIRTPMNGILGFLSLLDEPDLDDEEKSNFIKIVNRSGERLLHTINDLIEISKIETGDINVVYSELDILDLIQFHMEFFKLQAKEKGIDLRLENKIKEDSGFIHSDKDKLDGILTNLIRNAIKFTSEGYIEIGSYMEKEQLIIYVKDSGNGIAHDKLEIIFERFGQTELSNNRTHEGSGLGLSIVKAYIESLQGRIEVKSTLGNGSTFLFSIPIKPINDLNEYNRTQN